jgi:hypothetical protein
MSLIKQFESISAIRFQLGLKKTVFTHSFLAATALFLTSCWRETNLPTRIPTAIPAQDEAGMIATAMLTPSPTPEPTSITILSPGEYSVIDLGQPVEFVISATDPNGIRLVTLTSNGSNIGTFQDVEQNELNFNQEWTPNYAGTHEIIASVTSRTGQLTSAEPITIRVVDSQMLAQNAPIWANVEGNVNEIRGLAALAPIEPILLTRAELKQRLQADFFYTEEDAQRDVLVMHAFEFLPRDFDLYRLTHRYLGDSLIGFYDPATKEFVVLSDDKEVNPLEQWVFAHEFMHALQDQHFQLSLITDTTLSSETNLAIRALAEGEAELVQEIYIEQGFFTQEELIDIFNLISRTRQREVPNIPSVIVNSFLFPYTVGRDYAETLYLQNGWEGLNVAWQNLPQSTEHIIHPDRYLAGDLPEIVALPPLTDTLGIGWTRLEEATLGEFLLREYLGQQLDETEVETAATGWGGDRYAVYWHQDNEELVMVLRQTWDTPADKNQYEMAFTKFAGSTYGSQGQTQSDGGTCWQGDDALCFYPSAGQTVTVRAPDLETAAAVAAVVKE